MNNNEDTQFHLTATEVVLPGRVEPSGLQIRKRALMPPRPGQALVQMEASGVSFAEQTMRRGRYPSQPAFPFVPGYDFVGTIIAVGAGVGRERVGMRVAAVTKTGGWATHTLVPAQELVPVPEGLIRQRRRRYSSTASQRGRCIFAKPGVKEGQTILVHGANGGVGTVLCQIAHHAGVRVIGTAAPRHHDALRAMGIEPVDYDAPNPVRPSQGARSRGRGRGL
jgi:NADPH:quinone reductase-like Zn-dependent oxidoreductase